jgi:hypothetical protein
MPYGYEKRGDKWVVVKKDDGKVMGTHDNEADAKKQIVAIHMNESK